jgi:hypothetical protein
MAVWKRTVAGYEVKIHNVDHAPPHCHALVDGKDLKVSILDLQVMNPPPEEVPAKLRKQLLALQSELETAWESVTVIPPGGIPEWDEG